MDLANILEEERKIFMEAMSNFGSRVSDLKEKIIRIEDEEKVHRRNNKDYPAIPSRLQNSLYLSYLVSLAVIGAVYFYSPFDDSSEPSNKNQLYNITEKENKAKVTREFHTGGDYKVSHVDTNKDGEVDITKEYVLGQKTKEYKTSKKKENLFRMILKNHYK